MVLFPFALIFIIGVIVWVVRNEVSPDEREPRRWVPRRPHPPRHPRRGRPNGSGGRRGSARAERDEAREQH